MDVLHFMKEEYLAIRAESHGLVPCDLAESVSELGLIALMGRLELMLRLGDELIIPELLDSESRHMATGTLAEGQSAELRRFLVAFKRSKAVPESRREVLFNKISGHIDYMEQFVLPVIREMIPTAIREEIGEIAIDYRKDAGTLSAKTSKRREGSTISA
jgi:hypothetical protein